MLSKLLKNDLKKNMRWLWILFVATIATAGMTRGSKELGENIVFFKVVGIIFDSVFYSLAVNVILQPFLRNFLNFTKSFYSDESYLTHTLPVTKNQLINSKYLTALIEIVAGFICLVLSIIIMFAGPNTLNVISLLISTIVADKISTLLVIILFVTLVIIEFLMFISIIYFSIVMAYKSKEKRILKTFLIAAGCSFASLGVLSIFMIIMLSINGIKLTSTTLILSNTAFISIILTGIVIYSAISILFYFLTKKEFNKGVNID